MALREQIYPLVGQDWECVDKSITAFRERLGHWVSLWQQKKFAQLCSFHKTVKPLNSNQIVVVNLSSDKYDISKRLKRWLGDYKPWRHSI